LIRGRLLRLATDQHVLLLTMHHIISDAWSIGVLTRELAELYSGHSLPSLPIQYADYVAWQRQASQQEPIENQLAYWRERLAGLPPEIELPTDQPRTAAQSHRGASVALVLDADLTANLRQLAHRYELTLYMVLCAAWAILLSRLSGRDDIAIGTQVANRPRPELEALVGVFSNTLVLRIGVSADSRIDGLLKHVKEVTLGAYDHQEVPFDRVVEALRPQRSLARNPLFQAMFILQNTPRGDLRLPQLTLTLEDGVADHATVDLLLLLEERGEEIRGTLDYAVELFDRATVERWRACFIEILRGIARDQQTCVGDLEILAQSERRYILEQLNATQVPFPRGKLIHELFEEQVARTPNAPALFFEGQSLTYTQLNVQADRLARHLVARGVGPDRLVGLRVERSPEMIVGLLGILKAGGAYLPLDPALPPERLDYMLKDAAPSVLLTQAEIRALPNILDPIPHASRLTSRNLAYVIYTSGSTGAPKGVMVEHESVVNFLSSMRTQPGIEGSDTLLAVTTLSFDIAGLEIFLPLLHGAKVVLATREAAQDAQRLLRMLDEHAVTLMQATPATWRLLIDAGWPGHSKLKALCGGEALSTDLAGQLRSRVHALWNLYGPTETTIWSCAHQIETPSRSSVESIGGPVANTRIYILDAALRPVPIGVTGEIFIAGAGLARGYLNRPELTAQRFLTDPFSAGRMYRTGDLGRWRSDGTLSYSGRNDAQVKIRGFRIETGEIEARLRQHPQVKEAVVLAREDAPGERRLVAYVVADLPDNLALIPQLRADLREWLPDYMIPAAWKILSELPLTPSGKVDRNALPAPGSRAVEPSRLVAPQTDLERTLAKIWCQVLNVDAVGLHDNFFDLGGHSLLVLRAVFRINQSLNSHLTGADLYKSPTLAELARRVLEGDTEDGFVDLRAEAVLDSSIVAIAGARVTRPQSILLTGSTGFVGRFLLAQLLQDTDAVVYCLVRAPSEAQAAERLKATLLTWDLWRDECAHRMVAVAGDLRAPRLGIDDRTYQHLAHTIDTVYHCATRMNHLETYAATKAANVESSKALVQLATEHRPKLINFISTLDVFSAETGGSERRVSEHTSIDNEKHRSSQGYLASKWVSEKIFMLASSRGIPNNIFRLGLIWADTQSGRYDELQREHRILKTCLLSGYGIQDYHYEVPPTPVDYAARAIVSLANEHPQGNGVFHISSPDQMREGVFERCNAIAGTSLELLPLYHWTREIERLYRQGRALPIVPLIEQAFGLEEAAFYAREALESRKPRFDCTRTDVALESAGITAPVLNDELLKTCVENLMRTL
jgi:amino acid adenylation domain-containing protein/thioester reductase-like protein